VSGPLAPGPAPPRLAGIAAALRAALYGVVLYEPGELGELGVDMLMGLVKDLNATTRCDALAVDGDGQGRAMVMVGVWTTGDGPRTGFGRGFPEHDPWRFEAQRLVACGEADAGLWLAALPIAAPPWCRQVATLALVGEARGDEADIVVDVAIPGVTAAGVVWDPRRATLAYCPARGNADAGGRTDGRAGRPGAAAILAAIGRVVATERAASC
jgi:formylmethanofuran dehydrogenase subunit B